jgi:hypothetical protein
MGELSMHRLVIAGFLFVLGISGCASIYVNAQGRVIVQKL